MKKYLISLIFFISIFIGFNNVKAADFILDYSTTNTYNSSVLYDYLYNGQPAPYYADKVIDFIESNSFFDNYYIYIYMHYHSSSGSTNPFDIKLIPKNDIQNNNFGLGSYFRNGYTSGLMFYNYSSSLKEYVYYYTTSYSIEQNFSRLLDLNNYNNRNFSRYLIGVSVTSSNSNTDIYYPSSSNNGTMLYYSNFDIKLLNSGTYSRNVKIITDTDEINLNYGDTFPSYLSLNNDKVVNKVVDLGDNTFGFYQDYVGLNLTSLSGAADTLSVVCEEDRPFNNNYCFINYTDLINHNSDISVFNNYGASFTQMFGKNTGYLLNDRYYLYSFRIQKPFVPQVGNLFVNSLTNNSNQVDILGVYLQDAGSYTDYVVKFKISNSDYNSNTSLNDIMVVFRDGLSNYFTTIPNSFNYSVYRSFKLQYFSTEPTMEQVNNFYNSSDLSTIDGISSNSSFFTDNDFNTYGFGGIVTAPFRFLYAIQNYQTCSDIVLPFPHSNNTITLKCVRNTIPNSISPLITILQLILSGFICYRIAVETLSIIKDISSPEDASIEVVDL